jgi:hypothetical protein
MTSEETEDVDVDTPSLTSVAGLRYSIQNLWSDFGNTDSVSLGLVINLGLAAIGVLIYAFGSGWVAFVGAVWAILNVLGIVKWVFGA